MNIVTNEELILLKSEMDNLKSTVSEMKKEIKDHNGFSTQIALLNQTVAELSKVVKELKEEVVGKPAKRWETIISSLITGIMSIVIGYIIGKR